MSLMFSKTMEDAENLKKSFEKLAQAQQEITDCLHNDEWREDWRGWVFDEECECKRCIRFKYPLGSPRKAAGAFK
jgi:hypothetical protein